MYDNYIVEKRIFGEMRAVFSTNSKQLDDVLDSVDQTSDFDEKMINNLFIYLEQEDLRVGLLTKIFISKDSRGKGHGREFLNIFEKNVMPYTDIDLVFARVSNPQAPGFNLVCFYSSLGFEPIHLSCGDLLMANKGHAAELRELLGGNYKFLNELGHDAINSADESINLYFPKMSFDI